MKEITVQIQSVLYHNQPQAIERAIENLANAVRVAHTYDMPLGEVVVVYGDASKEAVFSPEDWKRLQAEYEGQLSITHEFFGENTGTAKGHNRLASGCQSEYIMIMNPDVVVNPHIFMQLLKPFSQKEKNVGITEARQTPIEHSKEYDPRTGETSWASTACAMFPCEVFKKVGGFDENAFFMYGDDLDFSWMVRLAGYKVIYVPGAPVFHAKELSKDAGWKPTYAEQYYSAEAALMLAQKWSNPKRVKQLLEDFEKSGEKVLNKVQKAFVERQQKGDLPQPVDPEHKVASFTKQGYGNYRFMF